MTQTAWVKLQAPRAAFQAPRAAYSDLPAAQASDQAAASYTTSLAVVEAQRPTS